MCTATQQSRKEKKHTLALLPQGPLVWKHCLQSCDTATGRSGRHPVKSHCRCGAARTTADNICPASVDRLPVSPQSLGSGCVTQGHEVRRPKCSETNRRLLTLLPREQTPPKDGNPSPRVRLRSHLCAARSPLYFYRSMKTLVLIKCQTTDTDITTRLSLPAAGEANHIRLGCSKSRHAELERTQTGGKAAMKSISSSRSTQHTHTHTQAESLHSIWATSLHNSHSVQCQQWPHYVALTLKMHPIKATREKSSPANGDSREHVCGDDRLSKQITPEELCITHPGGLSGQTLPQLHSCLINS